MKIEKNMEKSIIRIGAIFIVLVFLLFKFSAVKIIFTSALKVLMPFLIGGFLAVVISVPLKWIETFLGKFFFKKTSSKTLVRGIALLLTLIILFGTGYFVVSTIIPDLTKTFATFAKVLPETTTKFLDWFEGLNVNETHYLDSIKSDLEKWGPGFSDTLKQSAEKIFKSSFSIVSGTFSVILTSFLAFTFAIYLLFYKETLGNQITRLLYAFLDNEWAYIFIITGKRAAEIYSNFLSGTLIEAIIFGVLNLIAMTILRLPYKATLSILSAFLTFIPYFGAIIGSFVGLILISAISIKQGLIFLIMALALQQIEGNIIYPRVVGDQVGLPGIWVMVSVTVGGAVAGLLGMVLAVPMGTLIYFTLGDIVEYRLNKKSNENVKLSEIMRKTV
ncbi:MAG: AI-2E family transporter [Tissierellia bacterium]|nr:AI-2E family transporter [Tissierellia bacterium]